MEFYASELKASHEAWKETLAQARPGSDPSQIATEALELALQELEDRLPSESPRTRTEPLSLDAGNGVHPQSFADRVRASRGQQQLFSTLARRSPNRHPATDTPPPPVTPTAA